ncbi:toll/interleukin-1 receptor domain-containing protein [Geodermatophilus marinus]|uniref:toll/interleukin-1 receptor domain-containing protein n=1 Tax=Geodermatophilus sp. LHW52908 TaxID=2303986 RepID=UPI000E3E8B3B|nr:toll/interleukin-1 receptor domain-containing protein [Geodermatophilus sp. LHW52908]RFU22927.1 toll/interleukin-1 receptor domain-containing protein [Geodermatophilus sp. LHW52908]
MRVFLSYRRGDVGGYAGRLADALHERIGARNLFQDVRAIAPGQDYAAVIDRALDDSDVLLAVIGPGWLTAATPQGAPRLFAGDDYVRLEIARALDRGVRVVPVLVGGASLPAAADLPEQLRRLAQRQAVVLHDETWHQDVDGLLLALRGEPAAPAGRRRGLAVLAVAVPLVALGAGAWVLWGPGGGDGTGGTSGGEGADEEAGIASCAPPVGDGWRDIQLSADPTGGEQVEGGSLHFAVEATRWRPQGTAWHVVLATTMEAALPSGAYHGDWRYDSLVVGRRSFAPTCFSPSPEFVDPETVGEALVGFDVTCEPAGYIQLRLENDADRIDVTEPTLEPGSC